MDKLDIICGEGKHRSWNAALSEAILLNIYGNQPDYFWRLDKYYDKYIGLIKLCAKLGKQFGKEQLSNYVYKESASLFEKDIGLIIWKLKAYKYDSGFTMEQLIQNYKNKYRPKISENITNPTIKTRTIKEDNIGDL